MLQLTVSGFVKKDKKNTALYCFPADFLDLESLVLSSPSGAVEKYFDNLVTMIEDAAEGL